jgi:uncharacterized membrane protein (DUF485 family)
LAAARQPRGGGPYRSAPPSDRSSRHTDRPSISGLGNDLRAYGAAQNPTAGGDMVDWEGIERSEEFRELMHKRRSFVVPATIFFLAYYMGFILLAGYAPDFMGKSVYEGLTVGYCLALTQFVMVFVLGVWYLRKANREFDPLADRVAAKATLGDGRFERPEGEREEVAR